MDYIVNTAFGCHVYQKDEIIEKKMSTISLIQHLCHIHLFTYQGYLKACRKTLGLKYKIPLYISEELQLIPLKSVKAYDVVWINYVNLKSYKETKTGVILLFYDGRQLISSISEKSLKTQIMRLITIKDVKVKHFHS